jgi:hypothetical protein
MGFETRIECWEGKHSRKLSSWPMGVDVRSFRSASHSWVHLRAFLEAQRKGLLNA